MTPKIANKSTCLGLDRLLHVGVRGLHLRLQRPIHRERAAVEEAGGAVLGLEGGEVALLGGRLKANHAGAVEHARARDCTVVGVLVWQMQAQTLSTVVLVSGLGLFVLILVCDLKMGFGVMI